MAAENRDFGRFVTNWYNVHCKHTLFFEFLGLLNDFFLKAWFWGVRVGFGGREGALASALIYVYSVKKNNTVPLGEKWHGIGGGGGGRGTVFFQKRGKEWWHGIRGTRYFRYRLYTFKFVNFAFTSSALQQGLVISTFNFRNFLKEFWWILIILSLKISKVQRTMYERRLERALEIVSYYTILLT